MAANGDVRKPGRIRSLLNWLITRTAWLLSEFFGWRAALAVYPPMLTDKVAIVSGANTGIGLETTKALLRQGATVVMACRSMDRARAAVRELERSCGAAARKRLIPMHLDLESFISIKKFAAEFRALDLPLNILVNNAGIHLLPYGMASHGFERTMASNFFGHAYLIDLLLDKLQDSAPSRIVNMGSQLEMAGVIGMYTRRLPWDDLKGSHLTDSGERPYVLSKTMFMMYSRVLAEKLGGSGVDVFAVHPGVCDSGWYHRADRSSYLFSWLIWHVIKRINNQIPIGQRPSTAAVSSIYAAMAPELAGVSSRSSQLHYYGPSYLLPNWFNIGSRWVWNPWFYDKGACRRLFHATQDILGQVDAQVGKVGAPGAGAAPGLAAPAGLEEGVALGEASITKQKAG